MSDYITLTMQSETQNYRPRCNILCVLQHFRTIHRQWMFRVLEFTLQAEFVTRIRQDQIGYSRCLRFKKHKLCCIDRLFRVSILLNTFHTVNGQKTSINPYKPGGLFMGHRQTE